MALLSTKIGVKNDSILHCAQVAPYKKSAVKTSLRKINDASAYSNK